MQSSITNSHQYPPRYKDQHKVRFTFKMTLDIHRALSILLPLWWFSEIMNLFMIVFNLSFFFSYCLIRSWNIYIITHKGVILHFVYIKVLKFLKMNKNRKTYKEMIVNYSIRRLSSILSLNSQFSFDYKCFH